MVTKWPAISQGLPIPVYCSLFCGTSEHVPVSTNYQREFFKKMTIGNAYTESRSSIRPYIYKLR